jgi:hypothetical protein
LERAGTIQRQGLTLITQTLKPSSKRSSWHAQFVLAYACTSKLILMTELGLHLRVSLQSPIELRIKLKKKVKQYCLQQDPDTPLT